MNREEVVELLSKYYISPINKEFLKTIIIKYCSYKGKDTKSIHTLISLFSMLPDIVLVRYVNKAIELLEYEFNINTVSKNDTVIHVY